MACLAPWLSCERSRKHGECHASRHQPHVRNSGRVKPDGNETGSARETRCDDDQEEATGQPYMARLLAAVLAVSACTALQSVRDLCNVSSGMRALVVME